ncbi:MAG: Helicase, SNF2/RAD54 family, partial [uncultured Aureispira sp.]
MITEKEYGQTKWGKAWLEGLLEAVQSNTLSSGLSYATNAGVLALDINARSMIEARVAGFGATKYKQQIQWIPFTSIQKEAWLNYFKSNPNSLSSLLNQQLTESVITFGNATQARLLPQNLKAWKMACSCAEKKQPCKHLVAVLLVLSTQIEQNPLLLFELSGLNLTKEFKQDRPKETAIQVWTNSLSTTYVSKASNLSIAQSIDYSGIKNTWKKHLQLLELQTLFYQGDLKKKLTQKTKKAYRYYHKKTYPKEDYSLAHEALKQTKDLALIIDENHQLINLFAMQEKGNKPLFAKDNALERCIGVLETVERSELPQYADAFIALHTLYRFCLKLLKEQSFIPRILASASGYFVQWIPAYSINKQLDSLVQQLVELCPSDLLLVEEERLKILKPRTQILSLCHLFLGYFIQAATELIPEFSSLDAKVEYCFFSGMPVAFQAAEEKAVPLGIQNWLQPFYLGQEQYAPVLKIRAYKEGEERSFFVQIQVENRGDKNASLLNLDQFLQQQQFKTYHFVVLKSLQRLAHYYPDLEQVLSQQKTRTNNYSAAEFEFVFFEILPILKMLNISVILPKALQQLTRPRLGISIGTKPQKKTKGKSFMNIKTLLAIEWNVVVGDEIMDALEFIKKMKGQQGLVKHKEQYIHLDKAELQKILQQLERPPIATANQIVQAVLSESLGEYPAKISAEVGALFEELRANPIVAPPKSLKATLRPYQAVGYSWMYKNAQLNLGSLIADDMGLGKTLQVISLLLKFKEEGYLDEQQVLVIVPTSLLTNWRKEIAKFAPLLEVLIYHGAKRKLSRRADVIITSYGIARIDLNVFNQLNLYCTVIDEAQNIKNVNTAQTEAVKSIKANLNIAMSGTPVENRLAEYWSIMDYVNPNYLGSIVDFAESYSDPIEKENNQTRLEAFRKVTGPFILRRLKSDKSIIQDLPDKIEQNYEAKLSPIQSEIYQKIVQDTLRDLVQFKDDKKKRQGLILKLMGGLKQVCNHPYQYMNTGGQGPEQSGKGQILMDLLSRIQYQQEKTLIFTQYRKMGNLLLAWIKARFGMEPMYLHGGCSRAKRDEMVEAFQNDKQQTIFILSLKAAGTGLNLTAANHVVHYDLWWNPAVEAQATDRAYRIGQKKNVQVYRLITKGTLEEKIDAMIQSKKALADRSVSLGEQWLGDLSDEALGDLL